MFRRAIVTGSEGFIGGHLVDELLSAGVEVLGIDDMSSGLESTLDAHLLSETYTSRPISICDERIPLIFEDFRPDVVFHLAAKPGVARSVADPVYTDYINVNGSINVLDAARRSGVKRFIFSSSSSIYGGSESLPTKETEKPNPKSPYALQKLVIERYCKLYSSLYGIDTVSLRYFNIFGPRQRSDSDYAAVIAAFLRAEENSIAPNIFGSGEQYRDFTHVENAVFANLLAANSDKDFSGDVINIGTGVTTTINQLCNILCSNKPEYGDSRPGDVFCSKADISYAKDRLNYSPKKSLLEGLEELSAKSWLE